MGGAQLVRPTGAAIQCRAVPGGSRPAKEVDVSTVDNATVTPVVLGGTRGGPDVPTLRRDRWWLQPLVTVTILTIFIVYSTWAIFVNKDYYVGTQLHRDLISPFYSPCITASCVPGSRGTSVV